jgi:hypothetical protein
MSRRLWFFLGVVSPWLTMSCVTSAPGTPVCMAGAQLDSRMQCRVEQAPVHHLPFPEGTAVKVMQGFHGFASHRGAMAYAADFACEEGAPIVASRAGVVWDLKKDSNRGCEDPSCIHQANYVILDHGDGTYSEYGHLQHRGVTVELGEQVCAGQVIGLCGNTGYSLGPHLHYALSHGSGLSVPFQFAEARRRRYGFVVPEATYRSANKRQYGCKSTPYSPIPLDAFAHQGVILRRSLPAVITGETRDVVIEGTYFGDHRHVAIHRKPVEGGEWSDGCVAVDERGRFRARLSWETEKFPAGFYWLMITGTDERCRRSPGWSWSYKIRVDEKSASGD